MLMVGAVCDGDGDDSNSGYHSDDYDDDGDDCGNVVIMIEVTVMVMMAVMVMIPCSTLDFAACFLQSCHAPHYGALLHVGQ